uniref:Uncharacterized protein n=1 Tax=Moniliophthora roreri TaxID=221103 RepID=A0A0W0FC89_MONRR
MANDDYTFLCSKCARKPKPLRMTKKANAQKHLQNHGPAVPSGGTNREAEVPPDRGACIDEAGGDVLGLDGDEMGMDFGDGFGLDEDDGMRPPLGPQTDRQLLSIQGHVYPPLYTDSYSLVAPSFTDNDPSFLWLAYLQAVLNNVRSEMSVLRSNESLEMTLDALKPAGFVPEGRTPVKTLQSAKRRLGLDPNIHIIQYSICPRNDCNGIVYTEKRTASGDTKRHPVKIIPQVSPIQSLRRMVRRKGFRELLRDSRGDGLNRNDDEDLMVDMHDGQAWHQLKTGIRREVGEFGAVRDVPKTEDTNTKMTSNRFVLHLVANLDW